MKFARPALLALACALPTTAFAGMSCDDIMKMVSYNVPASTVIASIRGAGGGYSQTDVQCLQTKGAPPEVVAAVQALAGGANLTPKPGTAAAAAPVATPRPAPTAAEAFDDAEMLGGTAGAGAAEEPPSGGGPKVIEQLIADAKAKKYLTCSKGFYDLLEKNAYPDQKAKIEYHLGRCLEDLSMYHGAYHYYLEVVRKGAGNPYFKFALPGLVRIANLTGDDYDLLRVVEKIPAEAFPREAQNHLNYLMGRAMYSDGELSKSAEFFEKVSAKSELYMRAQFFLGQINVERGKLKSAVLSFREVIDSEPPLVGDARQQRQVEDMKDLAMINIARVYFGLTRYDNADKYYSQVDRNSSYWPESLFERAWASFHLGDVNGVLGLLMTANSPYYADQEFNPEITILRALSFFNLCEWGEVEGVLDTFEAQYKPMRDELKTFLDQYKSEENLKLSDQAYDAYFTSSKNQTSLNKPMFVKVLRNRDLQSMVDHMDDIDKEIALIDAQKAEWKVTVGEGLKKIYAEDRVKIKKRAGRVMLGELLEQYRVLNDLLQQSQVIRFEVTDAQRADYEFRMSNPDVNSTKDQEIDFSTSREVIYWPFNGEFWSDELGYYRFTEQGECK
jgi:tetratricopeptide (TPR) repeat protein